VNPGEYVRMYEVEDRHWWYVALHELVLAAIRRESQRLGRPLDVLDAGCGTGRLCQLLGREGHRVVGCDRSDEALRLCRQRGLSDVFVADLNDLELAPDSFDVVTSMDVLYHVGIRDDVAVLHRLRRGLRPGGLLLLNLVALELLRSTHDVAVQTRERYTRRELCRRVRDAGLRVERASYRVALLFPLVATVRLASRLGPRARGSPEEIPSDVAQAPAALNALLLGLMRLENRLLDRHALPIGSSLFLHARKPAEPPPRGGAGLP